MNINETPNLQPVTPDNRYKLPEKSASELEGGHFPHYVMEILRKKGEYALAELVDQDKISEVKLETLKAIETGNQAEKSKGDDFDVVDHMIMRAEMVAQDLIKNKKEHLH